MFQIAQNQKEHDVSVDGFRTEARRVTLLSDTFGYSVVVRLDVVVPMVLERYIATPFVRGIV